ncbi:Response regulator GacA [Anaerolineae bacterium]|nr:Response regulator GacA [Anaerolineae bacterium]
MNLDESNGLGLDENGVRKVSVMLVDDDPIFLEFLVALLQTYHCDQLDVVGTARSSEECVIRAQALAPEVVLMDLNMPGRGGLWAIPLLHILFPETHVIALTSSDDADSRKAVLAAGGTDLVSKSAWKTDLIPAIQRAVKVGDMNPSFATA